MRKPYFYWTGYTDHTTRNLSDFKGHTILIRPRTMHYYGYRFGINIIPYLDFTILEPEIIINDTSDGLNGLWHTVILLNE